MKKIIKLTESDLHNIIRKSVNRIMNENTEIDSFSLAMHKLYSILKDEIGGDDMRDL